MKMFNSSNRIGSDNYFEWWYFDFLTLDGKSVITIILHETDLFGINKKPYLSINVNFQQIQGTYQTEDLDHKDIIKDRQFLKCSNMITETKKFVDLNIDVDDVSFHGRIIKTHKPLYKNNPIFIELDGRIHNWLIPIPHGTITGNIFFRSTNQLIKFNGIAYHDHNWGNLPVQDIADSWVWGHLSNLNRSVMFCVFRSKGRTFYRHYNIKPGQMIVDGEFSIRDLDRIKFSPYRTNSLEINSSDMSLQLCLEQNNVIRSWMKPINGNLYEYTRWKVSGEILNEPQHVYGVVESLIKMEKS